MDFKKNDVLEWRHPSSELEKRDLMVVLAFDQTDQILEVKHINEPDRVERTGKVSVDSIEFLGRCSDYEHSEDVVRRYRP